MRTLLPKIIAVAAGMIINLAAGPWVYAQDPDPAIVDASTDPIELVTNTLSKTAQAEIAEEVKHQFAPISRAHGLYKTDDPALAFRLEFASLGKNGVVVIHAEATYPQHNHDGASAPSVP